MAGNNTGRCADADHTSASAAADGKGRAGHRRRLPLCILSGAAAVLLLAGVLLYGYGAGWFLPRWILWKSGGCAVFAEQTGTEWTDGSNERGGMAEAGRAGDSDGNSAQTGGLEEMEFQIDHRRLFAFADGECVWSSQPEILVQDALVCDIDRDGARELILLCWKIGRFGEERPFWVEKNDRSWSQHLFVYQYGPNGIAPQWMSSYMGVDVAEMTVCEPSRDAALSRGEPCLLFRSPDGGESRWFWDSWGFSRLE